MSTYSPSVKLAGALRGIVFFTVVKKFSSLSSRQSFRKRSPIRRFRYPLRSSLWQREHSATYALSPREAWALVYTPCQTVFVLGAGAALRIVTQTIVVRAE